MENVTHYCCTCGVSTDGKHHGTNPTTMCSHCNIETSTFCCLCGCKISHNETTTLCRSSYKPKIKKKNEDPHVSTKIPDDFHKKWCETLDRLAISCKVLEGRCPEVLQTSK